MPQPRALPGVQVAIQQSKREFDMMVLVNVVFFGLGVLFVLVVAASASSTRRVDSADAARPEADRQRSPEQSRPAPLAAARDNARITG